MLLTFLVRFSVSVVAICTTCPEFGRVGASKRRMRPERRTAHLVQLTLASDKL